MTDLPSSLQPPPAPGPVEASMPPVLPWFIAYCVIMAVLDLMVVGLGVVLLVVEPSELDMEPMEAALMGWMYVAGGSLFMIPMITAPFLPRRRWVWIFDLVMICLGMTSCCCLPVSIPLLIFWIKPECRTYFGWT